MATSDGDQVQDPLLPPRPSPRATYRVQLHAGFTFDDAGAEAGYIAGLGVSHLYLSPVLQAAKGSTHGYDVVDPTRINADLGGAGGHERLCATLGRVGLGQLLDVVPNHMAIGGRDNAWWWDVLANGPASRYASYFDVDWDPPSRRLRDVVMLPILGDHYGRELEAGRITLQREGADVVLQYFDHTVPIDQASLDGILLGAAERVDEEEPRVELERLAGGAARLPDVADERVASGKSLRDRLETLLREHPPVAAAIDAELDAVSADYDALDRLLDRQHYRLAWWRAAAENLDYRRFFDINDLAAIRVEEQRVFADSHGLILDWLARRVIDGVRVDHVDGLYDPRRYLLRLAGEAPGAWVLVEKILEGEEVLPATWLVAGTTGYDWLHRLASVSTYKDGWERLVDGYRTFAGITDSYDEIVRRSKHQILDGTLAADLNRLVNLMGEVCARHRRHRDYARRDLHDALAEVAAGFGVYRTYVAPGSGHPAATVDASPEDVAVVNQAVLTAGLRREEIGEDLLGFIRDILLGRIEGQAEAEVALRFQQLTGPVMAKAVEDTAFYRWLPLTSLNEVGGDPGRVEDALDAFHEGCAQAQTRHPWAMLATSTHDTKRSEDVRARIGVLAEIPDEWLNWVDRWWGRAPSMASGVVPPDRNTVWLLLQAAVGAWPIDADRLSAYLAKATREAKEHTSWTEPDTFYDEMLDAFARVAVEDEGSRAEIEGMVSVISRPGRAVALAMKLLTLTAPGVPDLYQGSELWDLSLVDPDNRRPVDYERRRSLAARLPSTTAAEAWAAGDDDEGLTKLAVVTAALQLRAEQPEWFGSGPEGGYAPLAGVGPAARHVVAFVRGGGAITVATRWPLLLSRTGGWRDTAVTLPEGRWKDRLSGNSWEGDVPLNALLAAVPVALLVADA